MVSLSVLVWEVPLVLRLDGTRALWDNNAWMMIWVIAFIPSGFWNR